MNVTMLYSLTQIDVKCVNSASGGLYYPDHLPILGITVHRCLVVCLIIWLYAIGAPYKAPGPREFASGDYVKVELDEDAFSAAMQSGNSLDTIMVIAIISTGLSHTFVKINF